MMEQKNIIFIQNTSLPVLVLQKSTRPKQFNYNCRKLLASCKNLPETKFEPLLLHQKKRVLTSKACFYVMPDTAATLIMKRHVSYNI